MTICSGTECTKEMDKGKIGVKGCSKQAMAGDAAFLRFLVLQDKVHFYLACLDFLPVENKVQGFEGLLSFWTGHFESVHLFII